MLLPICVLVHVVAEWLDVDIVDNVNTLEWKNNNFLLLFLFFLVQLLDEWLRTMTMIHAECVPACCLLSVVCACWALVAARSLLDGYDCQLRFPFGYRQLLFGRFIVGRDHR